MKLKVFTVSVLLFLLLSACGTNDTEQSASETNPSILQTTSTNLKQETSNAAKELIDQEHDVNDVIAVNNDKMIIIGINPKHHDRLQLKDLEKDLKKTVESKFNKHEIELSTDQKIFLELKKLEERLNNGDLSKAELNKELKRIHMLSKEQT